MRKFLKIIFALPTIFLFISCITINRQEPKRPFPYIEKEIRFINRKDNIRLNGTLTLPDEKGKYPVVILIAGSGPLNRDEEYLGHKPFLVLSDYLTSRGIAVLRYDKRQFDLPVRKFYQNTTIKFADDVIAAVDYLKLNPNIDPTKIGLIGHSEGGVVSAVVASQIDDISFIVLLAGPGLSFDEVLIQSTLAEYKKDNVPEPYVSHNIEFFKECYQSIKTTQDINRLKEKIEVTYNKYYLNTDLYDKNDLNQMIEKFTLPWFRYLIMYNPGKDYENIKCPILALNGELDLQVTPKENLKALEDDFKKSGNKDYTLIEIPELNHMFQTAKTGKQSEYKEINETIAPIALKTIYDWIQIRVK
jgi:uncharacterized protein